MPQNCEVAARSPPLAEATTIDTTAARSPEVRPRTWHLVPSNVRRAEILCGPIRFRPPDPTTPTKILREEPTSSTSSRRRCSRSDRLRGRGSGGREQPAGVYCGDAARVRQSVLIVAAGSTSVARRAGTSEPRIPRRGQYPRGTTFFRKSLKKAPCGGVSRERAAVVLELFWRTSDQMEFGARWAGRSS